MYTIGQVSAMFALPVSTLRYYDKEGLFPALGRASGIRRFSETELEALRVIECLKKSGMEIKDSLWSGVRRAARHTPCVWSSLSGRRLRWSRKCSAWAACSTC